MARRQPHPPGSGKVLYGAHRAGKGRGWAGIAVEPWRAEHLEGALIYRGVSQKKPVRIGQECGK